MPSKRLGWGLPPKTFLKQKNGGYAQWRVNASSKNQVRFVPTNLAKNAHTRAFVQKIVRP
jgi:chemotaxis methyl-accepting protein methylase